jgi:actin cytoskeleton-regulatory complex protein SLA1
VQKWQTADVQSVNIDKSKHVHIDVGGSTPIQLHFNAGSKDTAESIVAKLESSKDLAVSIPATTPAQNGSEIKPRNLPPPLQTDVKVSKKASVHFSTASPVIIPPREPSEDEEENEVEQELEAEEQPGPDAEEMEGEVATALYDFDADGDDELTIKEGEPLIILEKDGDEWWKVRNERGAEGVVPASYVEVSYSTIFVLASFADLAVTRPQAPIHKSQLQV